MPHITHESRTYEVDRLPDGCPLCHVASAPRLIATSIIPVSTWKGAVLEAVFRCPRNDCARLFIARYRFPSPASVGHWNGGTLSALLPFEPVLPSLPAPIRDLSPTFAEVLGQAEHAEALGLTEVAGMGQRKALEFLVKDYCISIHPDKAADIRAMFLAACIRTYVSDQNLRACAERAAWLGNDETHYVRLWESHDLQDLKALVQLTVSWIHTSLLTQKYLAELPPKVT